MTQYQKYPAYQDSGVEWLSEIPQSWKTDRVRNHFSFRKGLTITKENLQLDGVPTINYGEVHSKFGFRVTPEEHELRCVSSAFVESDPKALLIKHDFIFADTSEDLEGSGNFSRYDSETEAFAGYHTIIGRCESEHSSEFLAYLFDSPSFRDQVRKNMKGVKVFSITQGILKSLGLLLPPPAEQTAIAAFLDDKTAKIDKAIAQKEQLIALLKERKQIIIQNAVTKGLDPTVKMKDSGIEWIGQIPEHWGVSRLKKFITRFESGVSVNASESEAAEGEDIGVLKTSSVYGFFFRGSENKKVFKSDVSRVSCPVRKGAIIISRMNAPDLVGASGYVSEELSNIFLPDRLWQTVYNSEHPFEPKWLSRCLASAMLRSVFPAIAVGSSPSMKNISKGDFLALYISEPPLSEQSLISDHISEISDQIDQAVSTQLTAIQKLREYRATLIDSAVTGKIKVPGV